MPVLALAVIDPGLMQDPGFMTSAGLLGLATVAAGLLPDQRDLQVAAWLVAVGDLVH